MNNHDGSNITVTFEKPMSGREFLAMMENQRLFCPKCPEHKKCYPEPVDQWELMAEETKDMECNTISPQKYAQRMKL